MIRHIFRPFASAVTVTLFPGDGVGPEISDSMTQTMEAAGVNINWEVHQIQKEAATAEGDLISYEAIESLKRNKLGIKGPFTTPIGKGHRSLNVTLRKKMDLYANVRPCLSLDGVNTRYKNVDIVTIRENTEGEYSGLEHEVVPGVIENLKIISAGACERIALYAFKYAEAQGRKNITAMHKATIMKLGDGMFLRKVRAVAEKYQHIGYNEMNVDSGCGKIVKNPS
jgi:isocitrate dehydrogenase (NAD+)